MNAAPISVNLAASGNSGGGAIGQATKTSTLPAFAQVMAQKQMEAGAPKETAAATSGAGNANAANGSADAAARKSSDSGPVNAKSPASGNAEAAKKSDAKGKSSSGTGAGKSAAQDLAQDPAQSAAQVAAIPGVMNGAAPWVGGTAVMIPVEQAGNEAASTATTDAAPSDATGVKAGTTNATPADGSVTRQQGPATSELTNPIAMDVKNVPVSVLSAPVVPTTATESSAASAPATEAASGATTTPATASSEVQKNPQMPVAVPTVTNVLEPTTLINAASQVSAAVQSLPAAGNDPAAQTPAASSGNSTANATAVATSEAKPGDSGAAAAAVMPAATAESGATSTQTAPKNLGKRSLQEILRGAAELAGKEAQSGARVSVNAVQDVVGVATGKRVGSGSEAQAAAAPVVGAKNESPASAKAEPVTPDVVEAPEKSGTAKSGSSINGNSSVEATGSGNSGSVGSVGDSKDPGVGADPNAVHGAMSAAQNDPSNFAGGAANAVAAPVAIAGKDLANAMPVKAGDAATNGAPAAPDADDAAVPPNESRVVNVAQLTGDQGHSQVRIAMQADQLGQVELRATVHGQLVGAAITVEKKEAHAVMAAEMPSLQQALEGRQLRVGEVVLMQGAMHSTAGDAGNAAAEQQRRGQAGTTYQQVESETMYEAGAGMSFESSGIFDDSGRLSVRA
jgi:trimeric autotransporter adhesin